MKQCCRHLLCLLLLTFLLSCNAQQKKTNAAQQPVVNEVSKTVGGGCDGCDLMYVDMPATIQPVDTTDGWHEQGQQLVISGKIYKRDGRTPAPGIILYYYHTDTKGYYSPKAGLNEKVKRHGYLRGWIRSDADGNYAIHTIRPVAYPEGGFPAHIHLTVKEPGINAYYIDEFVFDDDKLLTVEERKKMENRGGSGILNVSTSGSLQVATHDIILGLNIPDY